MVTTAKPFSLRKDATDDLPAPGIPVRQTMSLLLSDISDYLDDDDDN
jgi:hypothetical protein